MSEKAVEEIAQAICDCATVVEGAFFDLKRRLGQVFGANIKEETFTSLLGWQKSKGERLGEFEVTSREANSNSDAYARALNILKTNQATIKQQFTEKTWTYRYWHYQEKIYRKRKAEAKKETQKEESAPSKEHDASVEKIKRRFPADLESLLSFEQVENFIVIKPRQYLGSEIFQRVYDIAVTKAGGEYVSAGKESHFKVPVEN